MANEVNTWAASRAGAKSAHAERANGLIHAAKDAIMHGEEKNAQRLVGEAMRTHHEGRDASPEGSKARAAHSDAAFATAKIGHELRHGTKASQREAAIKAIHATEAVHVATRDDASAPARSGAEKAGIYGTTRQAPTYAGALEKAKAATNHANMMGTSASAHEAAAAAHREAAGSTMNKAQEKEHLAKAKEHQSLADEYRRDERGRFAGK